MLSASNREISDSAPLDWGAKTIRKGSFMISDIWLYRQFCAVQLGTPEKVRTTAAQLVSVIESR
jgi:hypothetical protein